MPLTKEQREARKAKAEEARKALLKRIADLEATVTEQKEIIAAAKATSDLLEGLDVKGLLSSIEELKAGQETLRSNIRRDKGGLYVPGIEDEAKDFNLVKAMAGCATDWGMYKDTKEHEVIKAATEVARNVAGIDSEGGWFIPDQVIADVIGALYQDSVLLSLDASTGQTRVSLITGLTGAKVRIPKFESGMIAYWIGEKVPYTASEPGTRTITLDPKKLGLLTTMTDEMANRATYGFDSLLRNDMRRVASAELDRVLLYGTGTGFEPRGIINHPDITQFYFEDAVGGGDGTTAPAGTPVGARGNWSAMNLMLLLLENQLIKFNSSAAWISSPSFFRDMANLRTLNYSGQDETVAPYLAGLPPLTMRALRDLLGDFDWTTQIAANNTVASTGTGADTNYTDLFYGNWSEVIVGRWGGVEVMSDGGLAGDNWFSDQRSIKMRMYLDIGVRHDEALSYARDVRVFSHPA